MPPNYSSDKKVSDKAYAKIWEFLKQILLVFSQIKNQAWNIFFWKVAGSCIWIYNSAVWEGQEPHNLLCILSKLRGLYKVQTT